MANEYLLHADRERARRRLQENPLETTVRKGIRPSLRRLVMDSPEAHEHAAMCQNFGIVDVLLSAPLRPLPSFSQESALDQHHSASSSLSFEGKDYGTGKGVAMTCLCGQTLPVSAKTSSYASLTSSSDQAYLPDTIERQRVYA